jgi:teichuronic acid biosynthesis glycosyltransferase TuaG
MIDNNVYTTPLVSIIIPVFNGEKYLKECLESVCNQTYISWEIIAVNDGSTDNCECILQEYADKFSKKLIIISTGNKGVSNARNLALEYAHGKYIAFLDQDDLWLEHKLEIQVKIMEANNRIAFLYSNYYDLNMNDNTRIIANDVPQPSGRVFEQFLHQYPVALMTVMIRKTAYDEMVEKFDPHLRIAEEYDLFMRLLKDQEAAYIFDPLALYRIHSTNTYNRDIADDEIMYIFNKLQMLDPYLLITYKRHLPNLLKRIALRQIKKGVENNDIHSILTAIRYASKVSVVQIIPVYFFLGYNILIQVYKKKIKRTA